MSKMTLGIILEGKTPPDFRVPLSPKQCKSIQTLYPDVRVLVQSSPIRTYNDEAYIAEGIEVVEDLSACDLIFGVKEIPKDWLMPGKTYMFFSHTIKKQPYNRALLQTILSKKIRLIDYEVIKDKNNKRLIGFGRYAGIVGCYNAFLTYGLKSGAFELKPAHLCADRREVEAELQKVVLPKDFRILLTGFGRVGHGAREILDLLPIKEVSPEEYLVQPFSEPIFAQLEVEDYYGRKDGQVFVKSAFYSQPEIFVSTFDRYVPKTDMYIPCHFWSNRSPVILPNEQLQRPDNRIKVIADVSCDVNGPIASTIRSSKIGDAIYGYDPHTKSEVDFRQENAIAVMAIDNLPCELPRDASEDFGNELLKHVLPYLLGEDPDKVIERATETGFDGQLTQHFQYLSDYVSEVVTE
jgi:saccharopine dehydrogenase (NAD+, L-lysine forming)